MIKRILIVTALSAPLLAFAGQPPSGNGSGKQPNVQQDVPPTGNTNVNGKLHRSDKKTLKAYCEAQAKKQNLTGAKAKAAIAACEKS